MEELSRKCASSEEQNRVLHDQLDELRHEFEALKKLHAVCGGAARADFQKCSKDSVDEDLSRKRAEIEEQKRALDEQRRAIGEQTSALEQQLNGLRQEHDALKRSHLLCGARLDGQKEETQRVRDLAEKAQRELKSALSSLELQRRKQQQSEEELANLRAKRTEELTDSFGAVMLQEMQNMRIAFEKRLGLAKEEMEAMNSQHQLAMMALNETFRSEKKLTESRVRQQQIMIESLKKRLAVHEPVD